jgi:hypothetical protein
MENPRLVIALIAVMDAQNTNGKVIQSPAARGLKIPDQDGCGRQITEHRSVGTVISWRQTIHNPGA